MIDLDKEEGNKSKVLTFTQDRHRFKFVVENRSEESEFALYFSNPHVRFMKVVVGGREFFSGRSVSSKEKIPSWMSAVIIPLVRGENQVYIEVDFNVSENRFLPIYSRVFLAKPEVLWQKDKLEFSIRSFYFGLLFAMCLYYMMLSAKKAMPVYRFFIAYLISLTAMASIYDGMIYIWLSGPEILYWAECIGRGTVGLSSICMYLFTQYFLKFRGCLRRVVWVSLLINVFLSIGSIFVFASLAVLQDVYNLFMTLIFCFISGYMGVRGNKESVFYFLSVVPLLVGMLTENMLAIYTFDYGQLRQPWYALVIILKDYSYFIGTSLQMIMLAFAQNYVVLEAQKKALSYLAQSNKIKMNYAQELERKVESATFDLKQANDKLKEIDKNKNEFFTHINHELRTPLTLIIGPLQNFLRERGDDDRKSIENALSNAKKMVSLVSSILDLHRVEEGLYHINAEKLDVKSIIRSKYLQFEVEYKKSNIEFNYSCNVLHWIADSFVLDVTLNNLLANVLNHSRANVVLVKIFEEDEKLILIVRDDGVGIDECLIGSIFDRYRKGECSSKYSSGIGLSYVKSLVQSHQGSISVYNNPEGGASFEVVLPKLNSNELKSAHSLVEKKDTGYKVLLVEDNFELRKFLNSLLSPIYYIIEACDGQQGIDLAKEYMPDVIISDVMMENIDGYKLTEILKNKIETMCIPILLLTARNSKDEIVKGLIAGADDYLSKPFDEVELLARIDTLIGNRQRLKKQLLSYQNATIPKKGDFRTLLVAHVDRLVSQQKTDIQSLSFAMHMERSTLYRKCKKELNTTPSELIKRRQLDLAKSLLAQGEGSISEVAYASGFDNLSHFSRRFKKIFGQTPSQFLDEGKVIDL